MTPVDLIGGLILVVVATQKCVVYGFNLTVAEAEVWRMNTCESCVTINRHRARAFRACKLISIKSSVLGAYEIIQDFNQDLVRRDTYIDETRELTTEYTQFEILDTGYRKAQQIALDFEILAVAIAINGLEFTYDSCRLGQHLQRLMCHIRPVLSGGVFGEHYTPPTCVASRNKNSLDTGNFESVLNFAEDSAQVSTDYFRSMLASINRLLTDDEILRD